MDHRQCGGSGTADRERPGGGGALFLPPEDRTFRFPEVPARGRRAWPGRAPLALGLALVTVGALVVADRMLDGGGLGGGTGADEDTDGDRATGPGDLDEVMGATFRLDPDLVGSGTLRPVAGSSALTDPEARTLVRYRVDVEEGLPVDPEMFAAAVHRILGDERSWGNKGERGFARVSSGEHDFVVTLASPGTTAQWCAKSGLDTTVSNVSCDSALTERLLINAWRWAQGAESYSGDIRGYREMLINHEVGHRLGYNHHDCPAEGAPAPVMMQQTKSLTSERTGHTCTANPWPHPG
ncbi:DUF3152 domain-containing protein [Streptomyces sp. ACA25]|uniref:DUF3152 domain-containing protein n=1 Tax=Streptomyces sp. ACA25 TaxID=3022596 RepID=UPI002307943A|nr:DUF3152 domain-containing protein [Streptomyces sp. ACA25]MDB1086130.1 DUF3152 domain-containing protein [Streptomyces sp. ACA25]